MKKTAEELHTFVVCAYEESPYLDECIQSLKAQSIKSNILAVTSTPNPYIRKVVDRHGIPVLINNRKSSLAGDWNFALHSAETPLVTIAHQDDVYEKTYVESILYGYQSSKDPIILFTDYYELRNNQIVQSNQLLKVKRLLLFPLRFRALWRNRFIRRRVLSLGSPICCPSVTLVKEQIPEALFKDNMKSNIDWQAWEELSRKKGSFVYVDQPLMKHRIHKNSTTSKLLAQSARRQEDLFMYQKFWPKPVAEVIEHFYCKNEKSNEL